MHRRTTAADSASSRPIASGFTLIELVVVVAVVAVLAAIATPTLLAAQGSARDVAVQSDLVHGKTALTAFAAAHDGDLPDAVSRSGSADWRSATVDLAPYGWTRGPATTGLVFVPATGSSWCLLATSTTGGVFRITGSSGVVRAASCA